MSEQYIPTGNEFVSIPDIREGDGAIMSFNILHMGYKGLIEICGDPGHQIPFMSPVVEISGKEQGIVIKRWDRINCWIPSFLAECGKLSLKGTILAPVGERGFIYNLKIINNGPDKVDFRSGIKGCWKESKLTINESQKMKCDMNVFESGWNGSYIFELSSCTSILSFAPIFADEPEISNAGKKGQAVEYRFLKSITLLPGQEKSMSFFWGVGYEEVAAATSAKEMLRKTFEKALGDTKDWLEQRQLTTGQKALDALLNTNLFFNFFYASGCTMDTEEQVLVTSRSPRYYVSAAYWDRDSLFWSFPSILITDAGYAEKILEYVFTRQIRNVGIHSRYIDGTVLEPGFELDELCAPIIALGSYVDKTGSREILRREYIFRGVKRILERLATKKDNCTGLYETFLQPTDDMIVYPYLTYDNVLVWKVFKILSDLFRGTEIDGYGHISGTLKESFGHETSFDAEADDVMEAVNKNCIKEYKGKRIYAWSVNANGAWNVYDEPPGSLQLLPYYGFCNENDTVYRNTLEVIRDPSYKYSFYGCNIPETGCEHAPHPWILSVANSLLCGRKDEFIKMLGFLKMDNGIACESVDENTGESTTGNAFATCAGFLAYSIYRAFGQN